MFKFFTDLEKQTLDSLCTSFLPREILFTLIGGAACREYGLSRGIRDLDFTVSPYLLAKATLEASGDFLEFGDPDPSRRTCTLRNLRTGVLVDLVSGGIRISDRALLGNVLYSDPVPIPQPSGFGDLVSLKTLIQMKVAAIISGLDTHALGANDGGRDEEQIRTDINDVKELISICHLSRDLLFNEAQIQTAYENLYDGAPVVSSWA